MEEFSSYIVIATIFVCFLALVFTKKEPELVFGSAVVLLLIGGVISHEVAFSGLSNSGFITVACLYILAAGIRETGLLKPVLEKLLKKSNSPAIAQIRITYPVAFLSSFLNNTPIVAALTPEIRKWCKQENLNKRAFLLPLSYAAILGGACTLIGTSTNILVYGFLQSDNYQMSFFDISIVGVPVALVGLCYLFLFSGRILGAKHSNEFQLENTREYTVEMLVDSESSLVGKTIEQAKLRHLKGLFLIEILRGDLELTAVGPSTKLVAGDRLVFSGLVQSISELLEFDGLKIAEEQVFKVDAKSGRANLVEAVIGANNPLVNKTVKQGGFRKQYNAAVIAVLREGKRVQQKIGDIKLAAGDTLLLLARRSFVEQFFYSRDFLIVSSNKELFLTPKNKRPIAFFITLFFILASATGLLQVVEAAAISAILVIATGCISLEHAKQSLDIQVLLTIAAAFGLGNALSDSGGAEILATAILSVTGESPFALLVATYLITVLLTELVTNNAAAVVAYSIVSGMVAALGYNMIPFAIAVMMAASASFISPLGYQTNLMVYSAGRYQFKD